MRRKLLIIIAIIVVLVGGFIYYKSNRDAGGRIASTQSKPTYSLNLMSGKSYPAAKPTKLQYTVQNQDSKMLKDFDVVHEKKMHLIVVRNDRTNFQHVHPTFDEATGTFTIEPFTFPTDGDYRVYADFTPSNAQKNEMGVKLPVTPYIDVTAGSLANYRPLTPDADQLISSVNGFDTKLVDLGHDTVNEVTPEYTTGAELSAIVSIKKNGQPVTSLENYLGALGHMVVLGPDLEFIHAHPQTSTSAQTGFILFSVQFPKPGRYKLFLQTQTNGQVNTTEYAVTARGDASSESPMNMNHNGH